MGGFYSPMKLIELIKNRAMFSQELEVRDEKWYFSKAGAAAYKNAITPAQKTMYFFNYLLTVAKSKPKDDKNDYSAWYEKERSKDHKDIIFRTAYIMANSIDSSSLEFGEYPNILDSTKNPLVDYIKNYELGSNSRTTHGIMMLAKFHNEPKATKYIHAKYEPYNFLSYCSADGGVSDKYKLERDIIGVFCVDSSNKIFPPYVYDIVDPDYDDDYDDDDDDYE